MFLTQIIAEDIAFDDLAEYIKSSCSNFINNNKFCHDLYFSIRTQYFRQTYDWIWLYNSNADILRFMTYRYILIFYVLNMCFKQIITLTILMMDFLWCIRKEDMQKNGKMKDCVVLILIFMKGGGVRPTQELFTHLETSPLLVKGYKFGKPVTFTLVAESLAVVLSLSVIKSWSDRGSIPDLPHARLLF